MTQDQYDKEAAAPADKTDIRARVAAAAASMAAAMAPLADVFHHLRYVLEKAAAAMHGFRDAVDASVKAGRVWRREQEAKAKAEAEAAYQSWKLRFETGAT